MFEKQIGQSHNGPKESTSWDFNTTFALVIVIAFFRSASVPAPLPLNGVYLTLLLAKAINVEIALDVFLAGAM